MSKTRKRVIDWKAYYQKHKEQYRKWGKAYRGRKKAEAAKSQSKRNGVSTKKIVVSKS